MAEDNKGKPLSITEQKVLEPEVPTQQDNQALAVAQPQAPDEGAEKAAEAVANAADEVAPAVTVVPKPDEPKAEPEQPVPQADAEPKEEAKPAAKEESKPEVEMTAQEPLVHPPVEAMPPPHAAPPVKVDAAEHVGPPGAEGKPPVQAHLPAEAQAQREETKLLPFEQQRREGVPPLQAESMKLPEAVQRSEGAPFLMGGLPDPKQQEQARQLAERAQAFQARALQAEIMRRRQEAAMAHARKEAEEKADRQAAEFAAQRAAAQANQAAHYAANQVAHQAAHEQGYERVGPPRRAASARASQTFKAQAEYFDESPPDSPIDEPPARKPAPKPKPTPKAQPSGGKNSGQAWEEPPQKQLALKLPDINKALTGKWLQLFWPDDGKWWPGQVLSVDSRKKTVTLLYETGEEEANLELVDLVRKGEVAWLHEKDMPKEKESPLSGPRRGAGRGAAMWREDSFDEDIPSASTSRGGNKRRQADEDEEEEPWVPGQKRKAALKSRSKYRDESEEESSYSESPPPSDQSSDWHSSEDDDKPRRKPKKKKKKPVARPQPHPPQQAQPRQAHVPHQVSGGGNFLGRGGIFDDGPPFGGGFGVSGGMDSIRMQQGGQNNPALGRETLQQKQGGFPMDRNWGVMPGGGGQSNPAAAYRAAGWPGQDLNQLFQNRQPMNNGSMGLHIPQVSMQGGLDLARLSANPTGMLGAGAANISQAQWRPGVSAELMGAADWASQLNSQAMFRLPQMAQQQMAQQQLAAAHHQQQLQAQRLQQQQSEPQASRPAANLGGSTRNMESILSQGLAASGKQVEVQQTSGQWAKGTIVACLARGSSGGSVMVCYDNGRQEQLLQAEEGRTFNIRLA